jgi:ketosteroid isomerase-like protein
MSQSPAETISGVYDAFARGDIPALLATIAEDVEWRVPENVPHGGDFNGRDAVGRFFQGVAENWHDLSVDIDDPVSAGERVLVVARINGRLRSTGEQTGYKSVHVWDLRDGVPVRFAEYVDAPLKLPAAHAVTA